METFFYRYDVLKLRALIVLVLTWLYTNMQFVLYILIVSIKF
jgi:hypothetical protein